NAEYRTPSLRVRNRIYDRVFDRQWALQHMPDAEVRSQEAAYRRGGRRTAAGGSLLVATMGALAGAALHQRQLAQARVAAARPPDTIGQRQVGIPLAWGYNGHGQLGNGTFTDSAVPVPVSNLVNIVAMDGGNSHSLA